MVTKQVEILLSQCLNLASADMNAGKKEIFKSEEMLVERAKRIFKALMEADYILLPEQLENANQG